MQAEYLNQMVYCSTVDGRVFLREIAVTATDAAVTRIETIPPGYEHAMGAMKHMSRQADPVYRVHHVLKGLSNYTGCPYCHKTATFECNNCGSLSCISSDLPPHHTCPVCGTIGEPVWHDYHSASRSGLTGNQLPERPWFKSGKPELPRRDDAAQKRRQEVNDLFKAPTWEDLTNDMFHKPSVDLTGPPELGAPPPVKGLLGSGDQAEDERVRKALKKRFFPKK